MLLNSPQRAILTDYADGRYSHLAQNKHILPNDIENDPLLTFLLNELSTDPMSEDVSRAPLHVRQLRDEMDVALMALIRLESLAQKTKPQFARV